MFGLAPPPSLGTTGLCVGQARARPLVGVPLVTVAADQAAATEDRREVAEERREVAEERREVAEERREVAVDRREAAVGRREAAVDGCWGAQAEERRGAEEP